ncbi:DUF4328 domain-containing protein [Kitasatospora sp. NPDC059827]|uniref:DUF4328 domain-containing protein n=1 Tax=Kitasatospora sp. NPDC059827 TaxID=3346964 RepID=UPI00366942A1
MSNAQQHGAGRAGGIGARTHRPVTGWGVAAAVLIAVEVLREVLVSVANWRDYLLIHDYLNGAATDADLAAADSDVLTTVSSLAASFVLWGAAGVAFLVWLWRARINAEALGGRDAHRRSRMWTVGSWTVPVANLWYPYQVVTDIWRASAPRRPAPDTLVKAWWAFFILAEIVKPVQWRLANSEESESDVLANANASALLTVLFLVAGVLVILLIRQVTTWQNRAAEAAGGER